MSAADSSSDDPRASRRDFLRKALRATAYAVPAVYVTSMRNVARAQATAPGMGMGMGGGMGGGMGMR